MDNVFPIKVTPDELADYINAPRNTGGSVGNADLLNAQRKFTNELLALIKRYDGKVALTDFALSGGGYLVSIKKDQLK